MIVVMIVMLVCRVQEKDDKDDLLRYLFKKKTRINLIDEELGINIIFSRFFDVMLLKVLRFYFVILKYSGFAVVLFIR